MLTGEFGLNLVGQLGSYPETRSKRGRICIPHEAVLCIYVTGFFVITLEILRIHVASVSEPNGAFP